MRKETRNLIIRKATEDDLDVLDVHYYHNYPLVLEDKRKRPGWLNYHSGIHLLSAGQSDHISLFRYDLDSVAVLSTNFGLGYAGLQVINLTDGTVEEAFIQNTYDLKKDLGLRKNFFDYSERTQADILSQLIQ